MLLLTIALPPPVNGQSTVNLAVAQAVAATISSNDFCVIDIGPGVYANRMTYHFRRLFQVVYALGSVLKYRRVNQRTLYGVTESGFGCLYNYIIFGLARVLSYRLILHHHTSGHTLYRSVKFVILNKIIGKECRHIVLSQLMGNDLKARYSKIGAISVCNNAINARSQGHVSIASQSSADDYQGAKDKTWRVGFLSNLSISKGLKVVIDVGLAAKRHNMKLKFVIAGPISDTESSQLIATIKRDTEIFEFTGPLAGKSKHDFFMSIDFFVFPSSYRYEAQPIAVLEAMSYALPILASKAGYIEEILNGASPSFPVGPTMQSDLLLALERLTTDSQLVPIIRERVLAQFVRLSTESVSQFDKLVSSLSLPVGGFKE